jgi:hypothetical protein
MDTLSDFPTEQRYSCKWAVVRKYHRNVVAPGEIDHQPVELFEPP